VHAGRRSSIGGNIRFMSGADDPGDGLFALAELVAECVPLEPTMLRVAEYAVAMALSPCGAVLTMLEPGSAPLTVATSSLARTADAAQFELGEGPCVTALEQHRVVRSDSLATDASWPRYAGRARRLGVESVLAIPLVLHDTVIGVLAMYATGRAAFTEDDALIAQRYAAPAAAIVRNARVLGQCRAEIHQLRAALKIRPLIDQAIGIIRSRTGVNEDDAFALLRTTSNRDHMKISELAARIVEDAVRGANEQRSCS
jgi:GAF domain-containing protein